jgi:hypothetical protein
MNLFLTMPYKSTEANHYRGTMEQNKAMKIEEGDFKQLSLDLLREWWLITVQTLTDLAGLDTAIARLTPYQTNAAIALSRNLPLILNIPERSLQTAVYLSDFNYSALFATTGGDYYISRGKNEIVSVGNDCVTKGNVPAVCKTLCDTGNRIMVESFCPDYDLRLVTSLGSGDESCTFIWRDKKAIDDEDRTERPWKEPVIDVNIKNELAPHFFGELWTIATRAFLDFSNDQSTMEKLATCMHYSGVSTGMRLIDKYGAFTDNESKTLLFESLWLMHHPRNRFTRSSSALECTVEDCPFSGGPAELCQQFDSFFNGICEAIDPSYEFTYDRMMTKGDKTCHWTIRKKGRAAKEKAKEEVPSDDLAKRLGQKYIDGEITEEEFDKKMANLRKHGLVK